MWGKKFEMIPTIENYTEETLNILKDVMNKAEVSFQWRTYLSKVYMLECHLKSWSTEDLF